MLAGWNNDQIVSFLEDSTVVRWNVQEKCDHEFSVTAISAGITLHLDFLSPSQNSVCNFITDDSVQMGLVDHSKNAVRSDKGEGRKTAIFNDKDFVLRIGNNCGLVL